MLSLFKGYNSDGNNSAMCALNHPLKLTPQTVAVGWGSGLGFTPMKSSHSGEVFNPCPPLALHLHSSPLYMDMFYFHGWKNMLHSPGCFIGSSAGHKFSFNRYLFGQWEKSHIFGCPPNPPTPPTPSLLSSAFPVLYLNVTLLFLTLSLSSPSFSGLALLSLALAALRRREGGLFLWTCTPGDHTYASLYCRCQMQLQILIPEIWQKHAPSLSKLSSFCDVIEVFLCGICTCHLIAFCICTYQIHLYRHVTMFSSKSWVSSVWEFVILEPANPFNLSWCLQSDINMIPKGAGIQTDSNDQ